MLKSQGACHRQIAERPKARNGPQFDARSHVAADEVVNPFDLQRLDHGVTDPLP